MPIGAVAIEHLVRMPAHALGAHVLLVHHGLLLTT
jgi:hypothetical protein